MIAYREEEAEEALRHLADALLTSFTQHQTTFYAQNPHKMLAVTQTFGILQEAFPDDFPSDPPYRFDWDRPHVFHCDVIANVKR
jgi:hypothetical protein